MIGWTITVFILYICTGAVCAVPIVIWGLPRIDNAVRESSKGFRGMVYPGCVLLWPLMLIKWRRA